MILAISSIFCFGDLPDPEGPPCSLYLPISLFSISNLVFSFLDAIMLDSISRASSCMLVRSIDLLSLNNRVNLGSKYPAKVSFTTGCEGLTLVGILLYNLLNHWVNSRTDSDFFFRGAPNLVRQ
jgi:hypothetical protein